MSAILQQEVEPVAVRPRTTPSALVWRLRLLAAVVGFAAIAFRQSTGLVVPDTKLDLTADPAGFLARALNLWDPQGAFGQLQNQAYGYLFPVGPFHWLLSVAGLPPWVVQRLWWTVIFATALLGMWLLTRAFGVTSPWARLVAAMAFAAAPRFVAEVAVTSVEVWPLAMSPWVLLPLVTPGRPTRWRASRSALAFLLVGAVNAAATLATLVLPVLWLVTRRWDRIHARLCVAWAAGIVAVSTWWIVPLVVLGRFSPPFLSWIENASVTTSTASVFEALRGTSPWLGFLLTPVGPSWPAAWLQSTVPMILMATVVVASLGLVGVRLAGDARYFLALALVVGIALVTLGHTGGWAWPWAEWVRNLLDGPLAPFRNTHKFEPVVRVPLAVGLAFATQRGLALLRRRVRSPRSRTWARFGAGFAAATVMVTFAAPAVSANMARPEGYRAIPDHWRQAAAWLDAQPTKGSVLITPSASFADFTWGSTKDEPFQALMERPFVVRDAVPLGSAGATRFLDSLMDRLASGQRIERLSSTLSLAGIAFVLVRNDIRLDAQGDQPLVMTRSLRESGLERVASFGPLSGAVGESDTLTVDYRTLLQRPAVEIYATGRSTEARLVPLDDLPVVTGGPENQPGVVASLGARDVLRDVDVPERGGPTRAGPVVVTDGLRRREVNFGVPAHGTSGVLALNDPGSSGRRVIDYDVPGTPAHLTWRGVASVTASSSASDAYATLRTGPGNGPAQAVDGDPDTRWVSGTLREAQGEWLQVDFKAPTRVVGTTITLSSSAPIGARPKAIKVETDRGSVVMDAFAGPAIRLATPAGEARWLRVSLAEVESGAPNGFSIAELAVPAVAPDPTVTIPGEHQADLVLLEEGKRGRSECLPIEGIVVCSPTLKVEAEERGWRRSWTAAAAGTYVFDGEVLPIDGPALEDLLELPSGWRASASSRLVQAPLGRPDAGIDADPATGWVASPADPKPWYEVSLPREESVSGLRITKSRELPASTPMTVTVRFSDGTQRTERADATGLIRFPPKRTTSLRLTFGDVRLMENIDSETGVHSFAPIGFSELLLLGAERLSTPLPRGAATGVPCGFGPELVVGSERYATRVRGTIDDVLEGRSLNWQVCASGGAVTTPQGQVDLHARASGEFRPAELALRSQGLRTTPTPSLAVHVEQTSPSVRTMAIPGRESSSVLVLPQNFNSGWTARSADRVLAPIRVNGWQQGFIIPAGESTSLVAEFGPNRYHQFGLYIGALLVLAVLLLVLRARRQGGRDLPPARWAASPVPATAVAVLLGGPAALLAGLVAIVLARRMRRTAWVVLASALVAGMVVAVRPFPAHSTSFDSWLVQALVWLAIVAAVWVGWPRRRSRTRRISGRSMSE